MPHVSTAGRPALSVSHLSKKLPRTLASSQWNGVRDIAREIFPRRGAATLRSGEFWALADVSFDVARGEALAVIGANGAGKSTLLKVLYGLVKPDAGSVTIAGRVGALIELRTGFDPALTGRENVQVNAALHGFTRAETARLMGEITEFAGLEDMMEVPLQFYSSGMQAKLSFAVAAHLKPDLLLVDEVLAVGDIAYQRKCIDYMRRYVEGGGSLVFVSHSAHQVQAICSTAILLERGRLTHAGGVVETLGRYMATRQRMPAPGAPPAELDDDHPVAIESVSLECVAGDGLATGEDARLTLRYRSRQRTDAVWGFTIWTDDQWVCVTGSVSAAPRTLAAGWGELSCIIPRLPLLAGRYYLRATIQDPATLIPLALYGWRDGSYPFTVAPQPSRHANSAVAIGQLTTIDVDWDVSPQGNAE